MPMSGNPDAENPAGYILDPLNITGSRYSVMDPTVAGHSYFATAKTAGMQDRQKALDEWLKSQGAPAATAAAGYAGSPGYGGADIDRNAQQQWANMQMQLAQQYQALASGEMPSAAEIMLRQAQEQNLGNMMGAAAAQRGSNYGGSQRELLSSMGGANLQAQQQMGALRAQEQQNAMAGLAGLAAQGRGAEFDIASQQAQLKQQAAMQAAGFEQEAGIQAAGFQQEAAMLNPQLQAQFQSMYLQGLAQGMSAEEAMMNAQAEIDRINAQSQSDYYARLTEVEKTNTEAENDAGFL